MVWRLRTACQAPIAPEFFIPVFFHRLLGWVMADPKICDRKPCVQEMEPGTYFWCSCGHSASQPFCDGSHKGTGMGPVKEMIAEKTTMAWCLCKHTGNQPRCDGSHAKLPPDE